jgi:hypothetical protein
VGGSGRFEFTGLISTLFHNHFVLFRRINSPFQIL